MSVIVFHKWMLKSGHDSFEGFGERLLLLLWFNFLGFYLGLRGLFFVVWLGFFVDVDGGFVWDDDDDDEVLEIFPYGCCYLYVGVEKMTDWWWRRRQGRGGKRERELRERESIGDLGKRKKEKKELNYFM